MAFEDFIRGCDLYDNFRSKSEARGRGQGRARIPGRRKQLDKVRGGSDDREALRLGAAEPALVWDLRQLVLFDSL